MTAWHYNALADAVLILHVGVVLFLICGLILILLGGARDWRWVRNVWFRVLHLLTIAVVVLQAWLGMVCPLTTLEVWLRVQAGEAGYAGGFIQHWLHRVLFYEAPAAVFIAAYTVFGLAVLAGLFRYPPRAPR